MSQALQEPTERVSLAFQVLLGLASASVFLVIMVILSVLIPAQVSQVDPGRAATNLALVLPLGAAGALIGNPLAGALSDRTTSRFGRRRPWIVSGALATALGLLTPGEQPGARRAGARLVHGAVLRQCAVGCVCGDPARPGARPSARRHAGDHRADLAAGDDRRRILPGTRSGLPRRLLPHHRCPHRLQYDFCVVLSRAAPAAGIGTPRPAGRIPGFVLDQPAAPAQFRPGLARLAAALDRVCVGDGRLSLSLRSECHRLRRSLSGPRGPGRPCRRSRSCKPVWASR